MCEDLSLLTRRASSDVVFDPRAHVWPPKEPLGFSNRLVPSWMSGSVTVVDVGHEFPPEALVGWYH